MSKNSPVIDCTKTVTDFWTTSLVRLTIFPVATTAPTFEDGEIVAKFPFLWFDAKRRSVR